MAVVHIPSLMRDLVGGQPRVEAPGATVQEAIDDLDCRYPGVRARLCPNGVLLPSLSVAVDGQQSPLGLLERVGEDSEVTFVVAVAGG